MKTNWKTLGKQLGLGAALIASTFAAVSPAEARDRYYRRGGGDDAAIAIGAGVIGLAIGAAIADRGDDRYYDRGYYDRRRYVTVRGRPDYYYYYEGSPNRYYRDRYYSRYYQPYYRERWSGRDGYRGGRDYYRDGHRSWRDRHDRYDRRDGDRRWRDRDGDGYRDRDYYRR